MIQTVVKRDGRIVGFNEQKIMAAIRKAMMATDKGEDEHLVNLITDHVAQRGKAQMSVEDIQDAVELELMKSSRKDVAQKYIAYRNQRSIARKAKTRDMFLDIVNVKNNDITRENANMNADTPAGMMMKFASESTKALRRRLPAERREPRGREAQLPAHPRQGLLPHQVAHLRAASARQHPQLRLHCRPRCLAPRQAHRDGLGAGLHIDGVRPERDARRTGHSRLRLLSRPLRAPHLHRRGESPGGTQRRRTTAPSTTSRSWTTSSSPSTG